MSRLISLSGVFARRGRPFNELPLTDKTDWKNQVPKVYLREYQRHKDESEGDYGNGDKT